MEKENPGRQLPDILTLAELSARCIIPGGMDEFSPLLGRPCLLIDLTGKLPNTEVTQPLIDTLSTLPCPSIGLHLDASCLPPALCAALDVLVADESQLPALLRNIQTHPLTAAILVQLLRHNASCSIAEGLFAESLAFAALQASADFRHYLSGRVPPTPCVDADPLRIERHGEVLELTLSHGHRRNAYSMTMNDAFYEALLLAACDPSIQRVVVRGAGDCFSSGGDLSEFGLASDPAQAHLVRMSRSVPHLLAELAPRMEFQVHRACIGSGMELPAFSGRLVASANTYFQLPEISMGLIPGAGGSVSITRRIGRQRTAYLALSGRRIKAETALAWGLVDAII